MFYTGKNKRPPYTTQNEAASTFDVPGATAAAAPASPDKDKTPAVTQPLPIPPPQGTPPPADNNNNNALPPPVAAAAAPTPADVKATPEPVVVQITPGSEQAPPPPPPPAATGLPHVPSAEEHEEMTTFAPPPQQHQQHHSHHKKSQQQQQQQHHQPPPQQDQPPQQQQHFGGGGDAYFAAPPGARSHNDDFTPRSDNAPPPPHFQYSSPTQQSNNSNNNFGQYQQQQQNDASANGFHNDRGDAGSSSQRNVFDSPNNNSNGNNANTSSSNNGGSGQLMEVMQKVFKLEQKNDELIQRNQELERRMRESQIQLKQARDIAANPGGNLDPNAPKKPVREYGVSRSHPGDCCFKCQGVMTRVPPVDAPECEKVSWLQNEFKNLSEYHDQLHIWNSSQDRADDGIISTLAIATLLIAATSCVQVGVPTDANATLSTAQSTLKPAADLSGWIILGIIVLSAFVIAVLKAVQWNSQQKHDVCVVNYDRGIFTSHGTSPEEIWNPLCAVRYNWANMKQNAPYSGETAAPSLPDDVMMPQSSPLHGMN